MEFLQMKPIKLVNKSLEKLDKLKRESYENECQGESFYSRSKGFKQGRVQEPLKDGVYGECSQ